MYLQRLLVPPVHLPTCHAQAARQQSQARRLLFLFLRKYTCVIKKSPYSVNKPFRDPILTLLSTHHTKRLENKTFDKWVLHGLTHIKDTHVKYLSTILTVDFAAPASILYFKRASLQAISTQTGTFYRFSRFRELAFRIL